MDSWLAPKRETVERISLIKAIIHAHPRAEITYFAYVEGNGKTNHYFWVKDDKHVVILTEKVKDDKIMYFFKTSFVVLYRLSHPLI